MTFSDSLYKNHRERDINSIPLPYIMTVSKSVLIVKEKGNIHVQYDDCIRA